MNNSPRAVDLSAPWRARGEWLLLALLGALVLLPAESATPQEGSTDGITWNRTFRLADGRLFVTDGAISLDVEFAQPRELPTTELPTTAGDVMGRYMAAELADEFELDDLEEGSGPQTYEAPSGVTIAAKYVEFLRSVVPGASLRMQGDLEPVVIVAGGKPVGLVMAMRRPSPR